MAKIEKGAMIGLLCIVLLAILTCLSEIAKVKGLTAASVVHPQESAQQQSSASAIMEVVLGAQLLISSIKKTWAGTHYSSADSGINYLDIPVTEEIAEDSKELKEWPKYVGLLDEKGLWLFPVKEVLRSEDGTILRFQLGKKLGKIAEGPDFQALKRAISALH